MAHLALEKFWLPPGAGQIPLWWLHKVIPEGLSSADNGVSIAMETSCP